MYAIHRAKRSSPPTALPKPALALYNAAQVAVNAYVAWEIASALGGRVWGIGIADTPRVRHGVFLHYLCKYLDFADTLVIVLRKKAAQLSFLHLYHHASIVLVWGWVVATWPSGADGGSACFYEGLNEKVKLIELAGKVMSVHDKATGEQVAAELPVLHTAFRKRCRDGRIKAARLSVRQRRSTAEGMSQPGTPSRPPPPPPPP